MVFYVLRWFQFNPAAGDKLLATIALPMVGKRVSQLSWLEITYLGKYHHRARRLKSVYRVSTLSNWDRRFEIEIAIN